MTNRELKIAKAVLDVLHDLDGHQIHELPLHAESNLRWPSSAAEFSQALAICDRQKWVTGIHSKFKGVLWNINDAGESARIQMNE